MERDVIGLIGNGASRYQQRRYRSIDQAWVNRREQRMVATLLTDCHLADSLLLDVPCGYGRFVPLMAGLGMTAVGVGVKGTLGQARPDKKDSLKG